MAFARASAIRGAFQSFRPLRTSVGKPQSWRQIGRRGYASHGHETKQASSDLPWAIGAVAVTAPSVWYILQSGSENAHGHGDHHDGHGKDHGNKHQEEPKDGEESEDGDKDSEKSDDSGSDDEEKGADSSDTSKGEGGDDKKDATDDAKNQSNDELATSKSATSQNSQAGKQENLSNADNKHSTDIEGDPGKSKKGEGAPETAKSKGTVDTKRPQA